jgi:hypothetical protein
MNAPSGEANITFHRKVIPVIRPVPISHSGVMIRMRTA